MMSSYYPSRGLLLDHLGPTPDWALIALAPALTEPPSNPGLNGPSTFLKNSPTDQYSLAKL